MTIITLRHWHTHGLRPGTELTGQGQTDAAALQAALASLELTLQPDDFLVVVAITRDGVPQLADTSGQIQ